MRHLIRLVAAIGVVAATLAAAAPAGADVVTPSIDGRKAGIAVHVNAGGGSGGGGGGGVSCTWRPSVPDDWYNATHLGSPIIILPQRYINPPPEIKPWTYAPLTPVGKEPGSGTWFVSFCGDDIDFHWADLPLTSIPGGLSVDDLIDAALAYIHPPDPKVDVSPANDLVVNIPTWMWIDPAAWETTISVTASAGDGLPAIYQEATVTAEPSRLLWTMGDGSGEIACEGPGTKWTTDHGARDQSPSGCDHVYTQASNSRQITGSIEWEIRFSTQGAFDNRGSTHLGTIVTSNVVNRTVVEVQTLN